MSVLVYAESSNGAYKKAAKEAVYYGSKVATSMGTDLSVVTFGETNEGAIAELGQYGASKVLFVDDDRLKSVNSKAYTKVIAEAMNVSRADVLIVSENSTGKSLTGRLSVRLQAGLVTAVCDFPNLENGFSVKKSVFASKAFAHVNINTDKKIIAITPNAIGLEEVGGLASVESLAVSLEDSDFGVKVIEVKKVQGKTPLAESELVVSAGRGLKGPENWGMIEELAELINAGTACSRPVADMDWRPHGEHVGQTGVAIRPNLYIAVGISGAIQHLAGVNQSKVIVVINKDPEAPFFKAADYGIVGDAFDVVPKLIEEVKKLN